MSEFLVGDPGRTSCKGDKFGFPTFIAPGCSVHDLDMERTGHQHEQRILVRFHILSERTMQLTAGS